MAQAAIMGGCCDELTFDESAQGAQAQRVVCDKPFRIRVRELAQSYSTP